MVAFFLAFSSLVASLWIMFAEFVLVEGNIPNWPGLALFFHSLFIFFASLLYKFGRVEEYWRIIYFTYFFPTNLLYTFVISMYPFLSFFCSLWMSVLYICKNTLLAILSKLIRLELKEFWQCIYQTGAAVSEWFPPPPRRVEEWSNASSRRP